MTSFGIATGAKAQLKDACSTPCRTSQGYAARMPAGNRASKLRAANLFVRFLGTIYRDMPRSPTQSRIAMYCLCCALLGGMLAGASLAQSNPSAVSRQRVPDATIILNGNDVTRGPPPPPERQFVPPPTSLAPPMARVPQVAPLAPRVAQ